jgi:hypothetical protein
VLGDGLPPNFKFALGAAQDLMPAIELQSSGRPTDSIAVSWRPVTNARAYFLHAMGQVGQDDMVMWSSAETPDTGMGLFDYLPNATLERWTRENVLLRPEVTQCAIPKGIFAAPPGGRTDASGGMLRMIAYGSESNFAYPPRPADPKATWEPDWAVRVRVKSHTMAMLGEESGSRGGRGGRPAGRGAPLDGGRPEPAPPSGADMPNPGSPPNPLNPLANPVNLLKGLFGR